MNRQPHSLSLLAAASAVAMIGILVTIIFYYLFFEKPYLSYTNVPFPALQSVVHPGEAMPIHVARCNSDNVPHVYEITRSLERVNQKGEARDYILLPDLRVQIKPGCSDADAQLHIIPAMTPSGTWRLVGLSEVHGVLVRHMVEWYSVPFRIEDKMVPPVVIVIKGEPGPAGKTGATGANGLIGATGATGATGKFWGK